jgi:DNA excision repair protein ERCC-6
VILNIFCFRRPFFACFVSLQGLGKTIQVASFLGAMTASRKVKSILIISPATMLQHWLKEMAKWAPGVRRILIHQSGDTPSTHPSLLHNTMGQRKITTQHLNDASQWLKTSRRNRLFEIIDEADLDTRDPSSFCGTAYAFVTTFENVRRNEDIWTNHRWSYVVIDEAQKIRNPTADITLVCKVCGDTDIVIHYFLNVIMTSDTNVPFFVLTKLPFRD